MQFELQQYETTNGKVPFEEWIGSLDAVTAARIDRRLMRLMNGNFGDCKALSDGVCELRMAFGSGYRVYYGGNFKTLAFRR